MCCSAGCFQPLNLNVDRRVYTCVCVCVEGMVKKTLKMPSQSQSFLSIRKMKTAKNSRDTAFSSGLSSSAVTEVKCSSFYHTRRPRCSRVCRRYSHQSYEIALSCHSRNLVVCPLTVSHLLSTSTSAWSARVLIVTLAWL